MSAARPTGEVPPLVTSVVGIVVAVVSGVFGISAHGLAAGTATMLPTPGQFVLVIGVCIGIGSVTAALARHRSPVAVTAAGLLTGQGLVHLALVSGHSQGGTAHTHVATHPASTVADAAALRAAMDSASASSDALWTPAMLGAHLAAIVVTLAVVAVLAGALAWVAARVVPQVATVLLAVSARLVVVGRSFPAPDTGFLLARGGTRAPPVAV